MLDHFLALAAAAPDSVAVIDGASGESTSRAALSARIDEIASQFDDIGFHANDVIAIQLPNSIEFIAAFGAVLKRKLVAILIDRDATETEVGNVLGHFGAHGLISRSGVSTRAAARANLPAGARLIKLTSGSTGMPKGIVATEAN